MTLDTCVKHGTGVQCHRPIDGKMMYSDIDFVYHKFQLLTSYL